ncbi:hypothetical protein IWX90DRAFT_411070 [Phyllosticta citrichinensis]|uniref:Protein Zds1 C-terminal domain-containing protein n=1 Tax=Phyllosticta citrichinensis TaxID=1130410 RepID=A0ABR1Y6W6_9PEZI
MSLACARAQHPLPPCDRNVAEVESRRGSAVFLEQPCRLVLPLSARSPRCRPRATQQIARPVHRPPFLAVSLCLADLCPLLALQVSDRKQHLERLYQARHGHAPQLSITDDAHHITEAIGDMYGENDHTRRESRPLSFISSPTTDSFDSADSFYQQHPSSPPSAHGSSPPRNYTNGSPRENTRNRRSAAYDRSPMSPPRFTRHDSDGSNQPFEFQDIDAQSSPAAVAQELSNLQAIRRMSMDVHGSDPDLPSFASNVPMPAVAPSHSADDDDPSRMFWVPARVHPELAPKEFKTFIEEKVASHRRRSGDIDEGMLSPEGLSRDGSIGGLRRKKSMLSKQVDGPNGYHDGAERLERKRSLSQPNGMAHNPTLQQLESLTEDPASLVRKVSLNEGGESGSESQENDDVPILPVKPAGQSLKRSTRTNYRRGSLRKGERIPFSRRMANRQGDLTDGEDSSPVSSSSPEIKLGLQRVHTDPIPSNTGTKDESPQNFSRPHRTRSPSNGLHTTGAEQPRPRSAEEPAQQTSVNREDMAPQQPRAFHSRIGSNGRTTATLPGYSANRPESTGSTPSTPASPIPQIVETPPPADQPPPIPAQHPERKSSKSSADRAQANPPALTSPRIPPPTPVPRPPPGRQSLREKAQASKPPTQTLDDMASHPSAIPGHTSATRTDSLSIIPTFADEKKDKADKKSKDKDDGSEGGSRKASWGWFSRAKGNDKDDDDEAEKKDKKDKEERKTKSKLTKTDKSHDATRLDVLQSSIDEGRGRESLVLDRNSIKLDEERQKTSSRKTSGGEKKEKEGIFSSIFGGSKKKGDRDSGGKKISLQRGLSPDPPPRILKPDVDYNWTRFSILEERAIYRMAHIKLANPRRELYSQVLLSNFMYSYLAKVQQMHPHIQIGQTAQQKQQQRQAQEQKKKEEEQQRHQQQQQQQQQQQPEEFNTYQRYQDQQAEADTHESSYEGSGQAAQHYANHAESPEHDQGSSMAQNRSESYAMYQQSQPPHSPQPQPHMSSQYQHQGRSVSNGYSVSSGQHYLGQSHSHQQQPYYGQARTPSYEDDEDDGEGHDMW